MVNDALLTRTGFLLLVNGTSHLLLQTFAAPIGWRNFDGGATARSVDDGGATARSMDEGSAS